jgi:thioredoxin reductase (NADPH)
MKDPAENYRTRVEFDYVSDIVTDQHPFIVRTAEGKEYRTKPIIIATGARPRYLEIPGEKEYMGKGVSYCATCDGFFFRGKDVVVVGGGDSAVEEALFLTKFATRVRVIHRRDQLRASKILQDRAFANEKIEFVWNTVVNEILGDETGKVRGMVVQNTESGEVSELQTDGVFVFIGHLPNNNLLQGTFELDEDGHLVVDNRMRTNVPGVFAAGEIMDKVYKQVATSVGQGCAAAMQAERWLAELDTHGYESAADPRVFRVAYQMTPA